MSVIVIAVVVTALMFDFTNGFHDTANAMATSIATGALRPKVAVVIAGVLNLVGAFLSVAVAKTISSGLVDETKITPVVIFGGLVGAILWNLLTWLLGMPSSSSHALFGGLIGATWVAAGADAIKFAGVVSKVLIPLVLSPVVAGVVALAATYFAYRIASRGEEGTITRGFRLSQIVSASMVALAHGTNDAQKTMGVISLALIAHGDISAAHFAVPLWVKLICATSMALGTATGGWRIINTMGNRITSIESPQGFAAEAASGSVILASSYYGYPLSTTQVVSGGVTGAGIGKKQPVHWAVFGQMVSAWIFTIPAAGIVGAGAWEISDIFGKSSDVGSVVIVAITIVIAAGLWAIAQRSAIGAKDLDRTNVRPEEEAKPAAGSDVASPAVA